MKDSIMRLACPRVSLSGMPGHRDACWGQAPLATFSEVVSGERPFLNTELRVLRDDEQQALFARFTGEDDQVVSTYRLHNETLYTQDVFELFIADTGNLQHYREIEVSPFDVHFTGTITWEGEQRVLLMDWDIEGFETHTEYNEKAHSIAAVWKLPYSAFHQAPEKGSFWRFNAFRVDHSPRGEALQAWQHTGVRNFHVPERFGFLDFT